MCYSAHCLINDATMTRLFGIYCGRWKIFFNLVIGQFLCFARKYTYIYIYSTKKWISFLLHLLGSKTRFSRGVCFAVSYSAWLTAFPSIPIFFSHSCLAVDVSPLVLSRSNRVFARPHGFHRTSFLPFFLPPRLVSFLSLLLESRLTLSPLMSALPSSKLNILHLDQELCYRFIRLDERGVKRGSAPPKWTEGVLCFSGIDDQESRGGEIYADSLVTSVCNLHATHGPLMLISDGYRA